MSEQDKIAIVEELLQEKKINESQKRDLRECVALLICDEKGRDYLKNKLAQNTFRGRKPLLWAIVREIKKVVSEASDDTVAEVQRLATTVASACTVKDE